MFIYYIVIYIYITYRYISQVVSELRGPGSGQNFQLLGQKAWSRSSEGPAARWSLITMKSVVFIWGFPYSYGHLPVITGYFYGIIYAINGVISTYNW